MGAGAAVEAGAADEAGAPLCSAEAAWYSLGIWIVWPVTTWAVSASPLAAASDRVVKLLAAAIDQSVSPGWTVCATNALDVAGASSVTSAAMATPRMERRKMYPSRRIRRGFAVTRTAPCHRGVAMST